MSIGLQSKVPAACVPLHRKRDSLMLAAQRRGSSLAAAAPPLWLRDDVDTEAVRPPRLDFTVGGSTWGSAPGPPRGWCQVCVPWWWLGWWWGGSDEADVGADAASSEVHPRMSLAASWDSVPASTNCCSAECWLGTAHTWQPQE